MHRTPATEPTRSPTSPMGATRTDPPVPAPLTRRFEAIVLNWDGVGGLASPTAMTRLRGLVEDACGAGIEVAIVSEADVATVGVSSRRGPEGLQVSCWRSTVARRCSGVDRDGPRLVKRAAAADAGLANPKVTGDAEHLEIGLTDESDWARWVMRELWRMGIGPRSPPVRLSPT
jgi:hypothetical protein